MNERALEGTLIAGKYRVKRRIGSGGMGAVYEGEHVEIGKRVAIKVIEHQHARSTELAARFRREARAASAVESEHIVQVFDVGQDDAIGLYMVMELLVGEDLSSRLEKTGGKIPVEEAMTIATQAARALGKAHAAGVVHRDLKPANLFLTTREDGSVSVKVLDFGISKLVRPEHDAKSSNLTREGSVMGTPMYMSPEQAQGLAVDARSDVWSLASVLYEALSGRTAYDARDTYEQMIVQIVTQKPRPIEEVAPWVPAAIARVIESALAHDVALRIPDAASFAKKLAEAAHMPATPSDPDLTVLASASPSSDGRVVVRASTDAASPPTGTGVVVGARTELDSGLPRKRGPAIWLALAGAVIVVASAVAFVTRAPATNASTQGAQGGLVATTAEPSAVTSASPSPSDSAAATSTTRLQPLGTATATSAASPDTSAAVPAPTAAAIATKPTADAGARTTGRAAPGAAGPAPSAATTKAGTSQYGAAGVSTAY